jgi:hypothetical protein
MDLEKERQKQRAANLCWIRSSLLASVDIMEFQTTDAYYSLDRTGAMYSLSIDSIEEKLKISWHGHGSDVYYQYR